MFPSINNEKESYSSYKERSLFYFLIACNFYGLAS